MQVKLKPCAGEDCNGALRQIWKQEGKIRYCKKCWQKILSGEKIVPLFKAQKPISKRSDKRAKQELVYSILRKSFLKAHNQCQAVVDHNCLGKSDQVHHKAGRIGGLLCDDTKFLAVCASCHFYIENNREEAIDKGWSELRTNK